MPEEPKRPLKVFLCHASQDKPVVRELSRRLASEGWVDPWVDEKKLLPGHDWRTIIEEAVETSDIVIICLSSNSVTKEGFVQKELRYAREIAFEKPDETIFLIPLRLDDCTVPRGLRFYQWADYFGEKKEETYDALLESLKLRHEQKLKLEEVERAQKEKQERDAAEKAAQKEAERLRQEKDKREREILELERTIGERLERKTIEGEGVNVKVNHANWDKEPLLKFILENERASGIIIAIVSILLVIGGILLALAENSAAPPPHLTSTKSLLSPTASITSKPVSTTTSIATSNNTATVEPTFTPTEILTSTATPLPMELTDAKGVSMVLVPAGEFVMGISLDDAVVRCNKTDSDCRESLFQDLVPPHDVHLDSFYMDKFEITNGLYSVCVTAGICDPPTRNRSRSRVSYYGDSQFDNFPVVFVSKQMANVYCEWRGGHLPTEAEWEKAARGTDELTFPWGNDLGTGSANYDGLDTVAVGSYEGGKSVYGVYDMAGNVWEWVSDWYSESYYSISPLVNPKGPDSGERFVQRGGGFYLKSNAVSYMSTYFRSQPAPDEVYDSTGFRCAKDTTQE
jgi:formylglycine-generating enzyme required for sulfatase activity